MNPRPEVGPERPWAFPEPVESTLSNGLRLLVHDVPGQHVLSVRIVVPLTLADEPEGQDGVASLMARLLDEGSTRHTAEEFAEALERCGAALGAGASDGALSIDLDVPARFLETALDLLLEAVADPVFPEDQVRRIRSSRLAEIEQERASSAHRAARQLIATMYAADDRASRPTAGSAETVATLTRQHIVDFHARRLGPRGATVVIGGDLCGIDAVAQVARTLGQWQAPGHTPASPLLAPRRAPDAHRIVLVDRPGSVQTEIAIGASGPDRRIDSGWAPFPVLAFLVGGSPNARIDAVLREEKGYTYGIRAGFRPRVSGGSFVVSGSVRADVTTESVALLLDILGRVREGFTDAEVRSGVDHVSKTAPGRFATADAVVDETAGLAVEGLGLDFTTKNLAAVRKLDGRRLRDAWVEHVTGEWTIVLVGDAAAIRSADKDGVLTGAQVLTS